MLVKAQNAVTRISDDERLNVENYMESLNYISNLYLFIKTLQTVIPMNAVTFLPSFKGKYIVEKLGIPSTDKENTLKYFKVSSRLFLEDATKKKVSYTLKEICEDIFSVGEVMIFTLK